MGCLALGGAQQVFNGIVIGGIAGQLSYGQAVSMLSEKSLDFGGPMIGRTVLYQKQGLGGLCQHHRQEANVGVGIQLARDPLPKELSGEKLNQTKDLVDFAFAGGLNQRLLSTRCPRVAQRSPL